MNRKDIITDFIIFILLYEIEANEYKQLYFFNNRDTNKESYQNYVDSVNKFIQIDEFIEDIETNNKVYSNITSLDELINDHTEIYDLQLYFEDNFISEFDYETDVDGTTLGAKIYLHLSIEEIESYFILYLKLRKINPHQYITYYQQFLNSLKAKSRNIIHATTDRLNNFYKTKKRIGSILYLELKKELLSEIKSNLLKCLQETKFQMQGNFDKNGFISNYEETLKQILQSHNSIYSKLELETEPRQYFALIEYYYFLYKIEDKTAPEKSKDNEELDQEFENLKEENQKQITFLKNKGFNDNEVNIIFNCFSFNKFNKLGIRHINTPSKISWFSFFYFFYRFEFLENEDEIKLTNQNSFLEVTLTKENEIIDQNMYFKYYKHSKDNIGIEHKPHKDFPFKQAENLLKQIKGELFINLKKLNIPSNLQSIVENIN